jgi:hypothetical protein
LALCGAFAAALTDVRPARWAAVTAACAPAAATLAGFVVVAMTTSSDLVIVATGAIAAGTVAAVALPLCAQPRATANTQVAAGYDGLPTYPVLRSHRVAAAPLRPRISTPRDGAGRDDGRHRGP